MASLKDLLLKLEEMIVPKKELISPIGKTEKKAPKKQTWDDVVQMAEKYDAPIPMNRYEEFGMPTPTPTPFSLKELARNPAMVKFNPRDDVVRAIKGASESAGVPPTLLFDIALQESSFDPAKVNPQTKKHVGLFQFDEPTWSDMIRWGYVPAGSKREDPVANAQAAAMAIKNRWLDKWTASKNVWGQYYKPEELRMFYR